MAQAVAPSAEDSTPFNHTVLACWVLTPDHDVYVSHVSISFKRIDSVVIEFVKYSRDVMFYSSV
jgi:hypothetical protein